MHLSFPFQQFVLSHSSPMEIFSDSLLPILKNLKQHQSPSFVFLSSPLLLSFLLTPSLSLAVTLCVLMELSHCFGWNEKKYLYKHWRPYCACVNKHSPIIRSTWVCVVYDWFFVSCLVFDKTIYHPSLSAPVFQPKTFNPSLSTEVF